MGGERGVLLTDGREIRADIVVLAMGNLPPRPPGGPDSWIYDTGFFEPDPWAMDAMADIDPGEDLLLIGAGLTMVDVALPDGGSLHCYIPLSAMGDPPPTKARQVLTKGAVRPFVLSSLDPPRRVAELSLPEPVVKKRPGTNKKAAGAAR